MQSSKILRITLLIALFLTSVITTDTTHAAEYDVSCAASTNLSVTNQTTGQTVNASSAAVNIAASAGNQIQFTWGWGASTTQGDPSITDSGFTIELPDGAYFNNNPSLGNIWEYDSQIGTTTGQSGIPGPTISFTYPGNGGAIYLYAECYVEDPRGPSSASDGDQSVVNFPAPAPTYTVSCTPPSQTVTGGSNASFSLSTTPQGGFNSPVTWSVQPGGITPSSGTLPTVSFSGNGQVPAATTSGLITTTASTTPATYTITFTASGGSITRTCAVQLTVQSPVNPDFSLSLSPASPQIMKGTTQQFTVVATCSGGYTGPITSLQATTSFTGVTATLGANSIPCGGSTTVTISNTGSASPLSTPSDIKTRQITVTGQGN